jgi:uncharacterized membrane protein
LLLHYCGCFSRSGFRIKLALHKFVGTLAQVLADVIGFTISVVVIVVQLSASRFTPKVIELFLKEKVNFIILFLITIVLNIAHHFRY